MTPLLFDCEQEAVWFLLPRGFTIIGKEITWTKPRLGSHREIYAIDWLCRKFGYKYLGKRDQLTANRA
jgi:hypothetical protein